MFQAPPAGSWERDRVRTDGWKDSVQPFLLKPGRVAWLQDSPGGMQEEEEDGRQDEVIAAHRPAPPEHHDPGHGWRLCGGSAGLALTSCKTADDPVAGWATTAPRATAPGQVCLAAQASLPAPTAPEASRLPEMLAQAWAGPTSTLLLPRIHIRDLGGETLASASPLRLLPPLRLALAPWDWLCLGLPQQ